MDWLASEIRGIFGKRVLHRKRFNGYGAKQAASLCTLVGRGIYHGPWERVGRRFEVFS